MLPTELPNLKPTSIFSINDTCKMLGMSRCTLWRKTLEGVIKATTRHNRTFYTGMAITKYYNQR